MTSSSSAPRSTRTRLPPVDSRLLDAVRDPAIRPLVSSLTGHALHALADVSRLDDSLYTRFMEGGGQVERASPGALAMLRRLSHATFRGTRTLLSLMGRLAQGEGSATASSPQSPQSPQSPAEGEDDDAEAEIDFDFGEASPSGGDDAAVESGGLHLENLDIDDALDGLADRGVLDDSARWAEVKEKLSGIEYGLQSQLREFDERMKVAMSSEHVAQVLETVDDTRNAVGEGLFAVLVAVYGVFLPDVDASGVAPGYLSALQRALLVRRGVTDLAATVGPQNALLQKASTPAAETAMAFMRIREALSGFVAGPVFRGMRAADRWALVEFDRTIASTLSPATRQSCEGLSKFLESLGSINQREVLVTHDERAMHELRETLSAARPLISVSLRTATEMVRDAMKLADSLYGRSPGNDELLSALREASPALDNESEVEAVIETMELLLDDAPG